MKSESPRQSLRVLLLEDRSADAALIVHELTRAGFDPIWERVEDEPAYLRALGAAPDLILADFNMPALSAPRALALLRQRDPDLPFIVVSGSIGEETAVEVLKGGATDYLLKDRLGRLGEETAQSLGVDVGRLRLLVITGVALGVGGAVSVTGTIGFIGLVAPHLVRPLIGHDPARLLVPSALTGAALLLAADIAVRIIPSTTDIKVGVLTSIIGVPFFLYLIARERRSLGGGVA